MSTATPTADTVQFFAYPTTTLIPLLQGQLFSADATGTQTIYEVQGDSVPHVVHYMNGNLTVYLTPVKRYQSQDPIQLAVIPEDDMSHNKPVPAYTATGYIYLPQQAPGSISIPSPSEGSLPAAPSSITIGSPSSGGLPDAPEVIPIQSH